MQGMQGFGGSTKSRSFREELHASNMLLCDVREKPVLFEKFQEDELEFEADVHSFEEWRPVDWIPQYFPLPGIVRDPFHVFKLSLPSFQVLQGDEPEADVLRQVVCDSCKCMIADGDDDMEDSVPDLINDEISTVQDKVKILIPFYHDQTYIKRTFSCDPLYIM